MSIPQDQVGLHPVPLSPSLESSGWQKIGHSLGYAFSTLLSISQALLSLLRKVAQLASERLFTSSSPSSAAQVSSPVSKTPVPPKLDVVFQVTLSDNKGAKPGESSQKIQTGKKEEEISPDSEVEEPPLKAKIGEEEEVSSDSEGEESSLKPKEGEEKPVEQSPVTQKSPSPIEASPIAPVKEKERVVVEPKVINVPDDGNCLLYALSVGLRKKYAGNPTVQGKLNWDIEPELLTEDLYKAADLLESPCKQLRAQAAAYLEAHQGDEEMMLALMEGILSHLEVMRKKLKEEELVLPILKRDIKTIQARLKANRRSAILKTDLEQKQEQLKIVQASVQFQRNNMPEEGELQAYIDITKKDHIYCGLPQVMALAKEYGVPIRVIYNYDKPVHQRNEQLFNDQSHQNPPPPVITIAHVNGNHFQFVDD